MAKGKYRGQRANRNSIIHTTRRFPTETGIVPKCRPNRSNYRPINLLLSRS